MVHNSQQRASNTEMYTNLVVSRARQQELTTVFNVPLHTDIKGHCSHPNALVLPNKAATDG